MSSLNKIEINSLVLKNKSDYVDKLIKDDQAKIEKYELFKDLSNMEKLSLYKILKGKGIKMKPQFHKIPSNYSVKAF